MGIKFQPTIFESTGGISSEAEMVIKCLKRAVANQTKQPYGEVAHRFWQRLSIDIQRQGHRALVRRPMDKQLEAYAKFRSGTGPGDGLETAWEMMCK